jgi:hypothetical protein
VTLAIRRFAEQNCASISQLTHIDAELMAGIEHGDGIGARQQRSPAEIVDEFRTPALFWIKVDQPGRILIKTDKIRGLTKRRGRHAPVKGLRQLRVRVIELNIFESAHASL